MTERVLITGANGYLGARCIERCLGAPEREVVAVWHADRDRLPKDPPAHIQYEQCDLTDRADVEALFRRRKIGMVLHAAALLPDGKPNYLHRAVLSNVVATANLLECAVDSGCTRFVYCSSISVYGAAPCPALGWGEGDPVVPSCIYGWSKHAGEECVRLRSGSGGLAGVSVRLAGIHGGGRRGGAAFHMMRAALTGQPLMVNDPTSRFQLLFIDDAVDGLLLALKAPWRDAYQRVNLASHTFGSIRDMATSIVEFCGSASPLTKASTASGASGVMRLESMSTALKLTPRSIEWSWGQMHECLEKDILAGRGVGGDKPA